MALTRERIMKSSAYKIILWIVAGSMIGGSLLVSLFVKQEQRQPRQGIFATVNGQSVSKHEFEFRMAQEMEKAAYLRNLYDIPVDTFKDIVEYSLFSELLLNSVAEQLSIHLPAAYVVHKMNDPMTVINDLRNIIPQQLIGQDGKINTQGLTAYLQYRGISINAFEHAVENALKRKMIIDLASLAIFISPAEVRNAFERVFLKHQFTIYTIPFKKIYEQLEREPLSDDALKKFFQEQNTQSKRFWVPEERTATVWKIDPAGYGISITEQEIQNYYIKNKKNNFQQTPLQIEVRKIVVPFANAQEMAAAEKHVQDMYQQVMKDPTLFKEKSVKGTQFISRGQLPYRELENAIFNLKEDNNITAIAKTDTAFEIYQRVSKKAATYKPLESVKNDIRKTLTNTAFKKQFEADTADILNNAPAIAEFIKNKHATESTKTVKADNAAAKVEQKILKTKLNAFGKTVDEQGFGVVYQVTNIKNSYEPAFEQAKKAVKEAWLTVTTQEKMQKELEKIAKAPEAERTALIKAVQAAPVFDGSFAYTQSQEIQKLVQQGVPVEQLLPAEPKKEVLKTAINQQHDGFIVIVGDAQPFDETLFNAKRAEVKKDLYNSKKEAFQRSIIASLYETATIQRNV